ncbi:cyanophycin synthetase [Candidatus Parcubacteria bacterium]|nr:MAG: cyanophycin synthetase [Candidatus Parcubacteria bacterium]
MKNRRKVQPPLLGPLFRKLAPRIGAKILMEPEWKFVGQITYANGRRRYFRYSSLDLNPLGAAEVAKDKDYAAFFMRRMGYPAARGKTFFADWWCAAIRSDRNIRAAYRYARRIGFPVFVKPNSGSQGAGVALVHSREEFYRAMRTIFEQDRVALVQRPLPGRDYRIVVLDRSVISAYERIPLHVVGDGASTVRQLLERKQAQFAASGRDTRIRYDDPRILQKLRRQGLNMRSRPAADRVVYLLDNANLSAGGEAADVTAAVHPGYRRLAVRLARDMGLRLCGIDLLVQGGITAPPRRYHILEINAAPGLDHYATTGRAQQQVVEALYLKVLKAMA